MARKKTIESRVADEVLQRPETITIAGREYIVPPPTVATLIMFSETVAEMPDVKMDSETLVNDVLREARNCHAIGRAVAVLLLGAKRIREASVAKCPLLGRLFARGHKNGLLEETAGRIEEDATPAELQEAMSQLLMRMQLGDFFGLTTFLTGINTTRPTRGVETKTTASGR